jgi:hypothetical protein
LEALKEELRPVENANLAINGESVSFPVRLQTGWYLEYAGNGNVRVFSANGFEQQTVRPRATSPIIRKGINEIHFRCDGCGPVKVTIATHGEPLH